jgi:glycosyltransferase involved in cell wall biosynthesis
MEWIIIDDGKDSVRDLFEEASQSIPNIRYIYLEEKVRIGAKRNLLNKEAKGNIIIAMDDDDYYPADRVQMIVNAFKKYPKVDLAGSSEMYMYYIDTKEILSIGPHHPNHATNGTMAWRKRYSDKHKYDEFVTNAEEISFLDYYKHQMIQLDPKKAILVICHQDNTVDKYELRTEHLSNPKTGKSKIKLTPYQLKDIVKEKIVLDFYNSLT